MGDMTDIIRTFSVTDTVTEEMLAQWVQGGWVHVGEFVFTEDVQNRKIALPGQPEKPVFPRHVFVRAPFMVTTTEVISTIMGVLDASTGSEEVEQVLNEVMHNLAGATVEQVRAMQRNAAAIQAQAQGGKLQ